MRQAPAAGRATGGAHRRTGRSGRPGAGDRVPPAELLAPLTPPLPTVVPPQDPAASSALTAEGERLLRALLAELLTRIAAWEAWAHDP